MMCPDQFKTLEILHINKAAIQRKKPVSLIYLSLLFSCLLTFILSACGGSSDVQLANKAAPTNNGPTPGQNPNPTGPTTSTDTPTNPAAPLSPEKTYFTVCGASNFASDMEDVFYDYFDTSFIPFVTGPSGHGSIIFFFSPNYPKDGEIDVFHADIAAKMAYPARQISQDVVRMLFLGRKKSTKDAWQLYISDASFPLRAGRSRPMGSGYEPGGAEVTRANTYGGGIRRFGASIDGELIFYPKSPSRMEVRDGKDLWIRGDLDLGGNYLNPQMDESTHIFSAWVAAGAGFVNKFYLMTVENGRLKARFLMQSAVGTSASMLGNGRFYWLESSAPKSKSVHAVVAEPLTRIVKKYAINNDRAFFSKSAALILPSGNVGAVLAIEDVSKKAGKWKIDWAEFRTYELANSNWQTGQHLNSQDTSVKMIASSPYPKGPTDQLQFYHEHAVGLRSLSASPGAKSVFAIMEQHDDPHLFRISALQDTLFVDPVADEGCAYPVFIGLRDLRSTQ